MIKPADKEIEIIAERAAEQAVRTTLKSIGIDVDDPIEAQRDFYLMREVSRMAADAEFRKDLEHIRAWRKNMDEIKAKSLLTAIGILVAGICTAVWLGIKEIFKQN